jgi:hypothetical protein
MRAAIGLLLLTGLVGLPVQANAAGPSSSPRTSVSTECPPRAGSSFITTATCCPTVVQRVLRPGEPLPPLTYVTTCCPKVEAQRVYDQKTRRYRIVTVEVFEPCVPGPGLGPIQALGTSSDGGNQRTLGSVNRPPTVTRQEPSGTRPGWGNGDDNHIHTGPPGQADRDDGSETRPGWGYGDDNHIHTGPPGQAKK